MTDIITDTPVQNEWTAARLKITFSAGGKPRTRNVQVTIEELQEERRAALRQQGTPEDQVLDYELDVETFQALVYNAARQLSTSPLFVTGEENDVDGIPEGQVRVLGPWHIWYVDVFPVERSRILTPTQVVHVPQQRAN